MTTATAILPTTLTFQQAAIEIYDHEGKPWVTATQIAKALGYRRDDSVARIYDRNKDEFTPEMSETVNLTVSGNIRKIVRIFSPRGCHLIAMFARTERAKAFRVWVLNVLDKLESPEPVALPSPYLTPEQKHELQQLITRLVYSTEPKDRYPHLFKKFYGHLKRYFKVSSYSEIPTDRFDEARVQIAKAADNLKINHDEYFYTGPERELGLLNTKVYQAGIDDNDEKYPEEWHTILTAAAMLENMMTQVPNLREAFLKCRRDVQEAKLIQHKVRQLVG